MPITLIIMNLVIICICSIIRIYWLLILSYLLALLFDIFHGYNFYRLVHKVLLTPSVIILIIISIRCNILISTLKMMILWYSLRILLIILLVERLLSFLVFLKIISLINYILILKLLFKLVFLQIFKTKIRPIFVIYILIMKVRITVKVAILILIINKLLT